MSTERPSGVATVTCDGAAWITIDRPERLNALDRQTVAAIDRAAAAALSDPAARVLVLTGAGERAFVAGADIAEMAAFDPLEAQRFSTDFQAVLDRIEQAPKPVVAAINGATLGGGLELALACHLRIAAERARFGQPEINLGLIPGAGGTQRLPRLIGRGRALELILTGRTIEAAEALQLGLVHRVTPAERLREEVDALCVQLCGKSAVTLQRALEAVVRGADLPLERGLRLEAALFGLCFGTADGREGLQAFLEKRKPSFRGR